LLRHPHREGFTRAAQTEHDALDNKETFQIVAKSGITGVLPLTWIFDYKFDHNGYLTRYKARICVRGDLQPISEQETYAATVKMKIFRFILALIAVYDLDTWHADVTNAFLNSLLDEEVYCKFPDGSTWKVHQTPSCAVRSASSSTTLARGILGLSQNTWASTGQGGAVSVHQ
jgi:hypothetical protein